MVSLAQQISTLALLVLLPLSGHAKDLHQTRELALGVFPRESGTKTLAAFAPMARYLEAKLGITVNLALSKDYAAFLERLDQRGFDLVHMNHAHYVRSRGPEGYEAIGVNREFGSDTLQAAVFVRKDSPVSSVADLRGKVILFGGDRTAFIAYQAGQKMLRDKGLTPADYQERMTINPPSALIALARGQADAAVAGAGVLSRPMVRDAMDVDSVRILAVSEPYPGLPWAVKRTLPKTIRDALVQALLNLHASEEGRLVLKAAGIDRLIPARDSDFDAAAELVRP